MASRADRRSDELEGKFSERDMKRRWRSDRRKKGPSQFRPLDSDARKRRRFRRSPDDNPPVEASRRDWHDFVEDEDSEEEEIYDLDSDDNLDPDIDLSLDNQDLEDAEDDRWPNDWK